MLVEIMLFCLIDGIIFLMVLTSATSAVFIPKNKGILLFNQSVTVWAYAIGCVAVVAEWWAYYLHCGQRFRRWSAWAAVLWALQYALLGAATAALNMGLTAVRSLLSAFLEKPAHKTQAVSFFALVFCGLTAVSWQGWPSLLPAFAVLNTTMALFYLNNRAMRSVLLLSSLSWIANDVYWQAWPALLAESVAMLINIHTIRQIPAS